MTPTAWGCYLISIPGLDKSSLIPPIQVPYLLQHYSRQFVDNICMVKTDVEGHDLVILR